MTSNNLKASTSNVPQIHMLLIPRRHLDLVWILTFAQNLAIIRLEVSDQKFYGRRWMVRDVHIRVIATVKES